MENNLFNTPFEMGLRTTLLLSAVSGQEYTLDRILAIDFISCYAADFDLPFDNLHGNNNFKFGEIGSRRLLVQEAIKNLVTNGLLDVKVEQGYLFSASAAGKKYAGKFKSAYASEYKNIAKDVIRKYKKKSDEYLLSLIQEKSIQALKG